MAAATNSFRVSASDVSRSMAFSMNAWTDCSVPETTDRMRCLSSAGSFSVVGGMVTPGYYRQRTPTRTCELTAPELARHPIRPNEQ